MDLLKTKYNYFLPTSITLSLKHVLFKYNYAGTVLNNPPIVLNTFYFYINLYEMFTVFIGLYKKPYVNATQFFITNRLYKPKFINLSPANVRFKKITIYSKFMTILMRCGLKKKIFNLHSKLFKIWFLLNFHNSFKEYFTNNAIDYNLFYRKYMFNFSQHAVLLLTLESTRINKRRRKALRIKHKFSYAIKYLPVYRRLQNIYKWLHLDLLEIKQRTYKGRLQNLYNKIFLTPENLVLYKLRYTLHTRLLHKHLAKRV